MNVYGCHQKIEKETRFPRAGVTNGCELGKSLVLESELGFFERASSVLNC